jgi:hypothetical protein
MSEQQLDEWKLGLLKSANDLVEFLNNEVLQLREEKRHLQKKILEAKIESTDAVRRLSEAREIIRKASEKFCDDRADGVIAAEMFAILGSKLNGGAA